MRIHDISMEHDLLKANQELANRNRARLDETGVKALDIMGAIGSGKTSLIEVAIDGLDDMSFGVIAGDIVAEIDARRFREHGVPVVPLNTGKECHLDAHLVEHALEDIGLDGLDVLFMENVGNLVCPTDFDLGAHRRVVVVSVSEGDDIVEKHPLIFKIAELNVVNKIDIAEFVGADADKMAGDARKLNPSSKVIKTSVKTGVGIEDWLEFVRDTAG
ncbi:MAG: hydrogenase nickel incorporation protein HypB [Candidatus Hydrothermarchaeaceae archaeon]